MGRGPVTWCVIVALVALANAPQLVAAPVKLNGPLTPAGNVDSFRIAPQGNLVTYRADQDTDSVFELYSVAIAGGTPVKLSGPMASGGDVTQSWEIAPNGGRVVYLADQDVDDTFELYSVSIGGSTAVKLNGALTSGKDVSTYSIGPQGDKVLYLADQDVNDVLEIYVVPILGGSTTKLNGTLALGGDVGLARFTPNGLHVVYDADQDVNDVTELYRAPVAGGSSLKLNGPLALDGDVEPSTASIAPNSSMVVYRADQDVNNRHEIFSVPIGGGAPTKLNGSLAAGTNVGEFQFSANSNRVVYRAAQQPDVSPALYSVATTGGTATKLSALMISGGQLAHWQVSPDGGRVVYQADQETDDVYELYSVPIAGGAPVKLNDSLVPGGDVTITFGQDVFKFTPDGGRVVYFADQDTDQVFEMYSVPSAGGAAVKLNGALVPGGSIIPSSLRFSPDGSYLLYVADQDTDQVNELFRVPVAGGTAIKLNGPLVPGGDVIAAEFGAGGNHVVYLADQDADNVFELFSVELSGAGALDGDFNHDDIVDAADYTVWRNGLATGTYDEFDYNLWRENYGDSNVGPGGGGLARSAVSAPTLLAVPEPESVWPLAIVAAAAWPSSRSRGCPGQHVRKKEGGATRRGSPKVDWPAPRRRRPNVRCIFSLE